MAHKSGCIRSDGIWACELSCMHDINEAIAEERRAALKQAWREGWRRGVSDASKGIPLAVVPASPYDPKPD